MLRNIFSKLPGFKLKPECSVSSSCRNVRSVSPESRYKKASPKKTEDATVVVRKRAHSFPSLTPRACHLLERGQHNSLYRQYKNLSYRGHRDDEDDVSTKTEKSFEKGAEQEDACYFENCDIKQYELEAARPKTRSDEIRNQIEKQHREKSVFFPNLQPRNLRPFGSRDNVLYNPIMLKPTTSFKINSNNFLENAKDEYVDESGGAAKSDLKNDFSTRKFSTVSKSAKMFEDIFQNQMHNAPKETTKERATRNQKESLTEDFQGFKDKLALEDVPVRREPGAAKCVEEDMVFRFPSYSEFVKQTRTALNRGPVVYPNEASEPCQPIENVPVGDVRKDHKLLVVNQDLQLKRNLSKSSLKEKSVKVSKLPSFEQTRNTCNACDGYKEKKRREKEEKESRRKEKKKPREKRPKEPTPCSPKDKCKRDAKSASDYLSATSDILLATVPKPDVAKRPLTPDIYLSGPTQKGKKFLSLEQELPMKRSICMNRKVQPTESQVPNRHTCNACETWKDQKQKEKREKSGEGPPTKFPPHRVQRALEPELCQSADNKVPRRVCLPTTVRLRRPECTPKPFYDCKKPPPCVRADQCLKVERKKLPKLLDSSCPCVEPYVPDKAPRLARLPMKLCDPPRICPVDPCVFRARADDGLKVERKELKPLVPKDCPCVEPPKMIDIPLKRLKPNCPPEVCRPVRVCPVKICDPCERADKCKKVERKQLPVLIPSDCPCVPEPPLKPGPKIKRLNLKVPEPCRECPEPCICHVDCPRADLGLKVKPKRLPPIVPGDCPCIPQKMRDVPLKRLKCREEEYVCEVPDPCKDFQRADFGCWEYNQVEWVEVDEDCIEKKIDPCNPPVTEEDPCRKLGAGSKHGTKNMTSKRGYGTDSNSSLNLFYKLKFNSKLKTDTGKGKKKPEKVETVAEGETKSVRMIEKVNATNLGELLNKKKADAKKIASTVDLIKRLNDPEKEVDNPYMFTQPKNEKLTLDMIINKISASTTALDQEKSDSKIGNLSMSYCKPQQRMLSTTNILEKKISSKKTCPKFSRANKCKVKPPSNCKAKRPSDCPHEPDSFEGCVKYRTPICCEKTQSPYSAFSETMEKEIAPFTKTSQWNCDRKEYGFDPNPQKVTEHLKNVKDKKKFSTVATVNTTTQDFISRLPIEDIVHDDVFENKSTYKNLGKEIFEIYKAKKDEGIVKDKVTDQTPTLAYKPVDKRYSQIVRQKSLIPGNQVEQVKQKNFGISSSKLIISPEVKDGILTRNCLSQIPKGQRRSSVTRATTASLTPSRTSLNSKYSTKIPPCGIKPPPRKKLCIKNKCPRFKLPNCPPRTTKRNCLPYRDLSVNKDCRKPEAPFPAFSDCLNEELEEVLSECPYEREKISRLQPRRIDPVAKPHVLSPPPPHQGKIDPMKEEECIRDRLCLKKKGLSQTCADFGKFIKPLRSKDYFQHIDPDCIKLEEMKKRQALGNNIYKKRRFSTMSLNRIDPVPNRRYSSSLTKLFDLKRLLGLDISNQNEKFEGGVRRIYIRNYHALCKSPEMNFVEDIDKRIKEVSLTHFAEFDENASKILKLRDVQWRVNNFKKWNSMNKHCSISKTVKRFYNSSKNKYKTHVKKKEFSTTTKTTSQDSESCPQRGLSTNVSLLKPNDSDSCKIRSKSKGRRPDSGKASRKKMRVCTKFSLPHCPPIAKRGPRCQDPAPESSCKKPLSPYQSFSDCHKPQKSNVINQCPIVQDKVRNLQPKYSILPEIESSTTTYPTQPKLDPHMEIDYIRCKLGIENKGITQTCEDFGKPIKDLRCKDVQKPVDPDCTALEERRKRKECYEKAAAKSKSKKGPAREPKRKSEIEHKKEVKKEDTIPAFKKKFQDCTQSASSPNVCMYGDKIPEDDCDEEEHEHERKQDHEEEKREQVVQECKPDETLWEKICNYFKARPNCPAPDEWKKKALRDKAEKAAAAAGLCLIDPKDLNKFDDEDSCGSNKSGETVASDGSCDEPRPSRKGSSEKNSMGMPKRQYSTLVLRRCYSRNLNQKNIDDINRILEEEDMKRRQAISASEYNSDTELDVLLIKNKNQILARFDEELDGLGIDTNYNREECDILDFSTDDNIMPSRENMIEHLLQIYADDSNRYQEAKAHAVFQEVAHKLEHFKPVPSFEELEKMKTQSLVNELNKLLKGKENTNKEE